MADWQSNQLKSDQFAYFKRRVGKYVEFFQIILGIFFILIAVVAIGKLDKPTQEQVKFAKENPGYSYVDNSSKEDILARLCLLKNSAKNLTTYKDQCAVAGQISECLKIKSGLSLEILETRSSMYDAIPEDVRPSDLQCWLSQN